MAVEKPSIYINTKTNLFVIHWLISERCNENCRFCYSNFGSKVIDLKEAKRVADLLKKSRFKIVKFTGGEPLLYPHMKKLLVYCKNLNIETHLHTNGILVNDYFLRNINKYVDQLSLSLDGSTDKIQTEVTRPKLHYKKNIEILKKIKNKDIEISVKTLVCKINQNDIINLGNLLSKFKVDYWVLFEFRPLGKGKINKKMFEISHRKYEFIKKRIIEKFSDRFKLIFVSKEIGHSPYVFINSIGEVFTIHPKIEKNIFVGNILHGNVKGIIKKIKELHK